MGNSRPLTMQGGQTPHQLLASVVVDDDDVEPGGHRVFTARSSVSLKTDAVRDQVNALSRVRPRATAAAWWSASVSSAVRASAMAGTLSGTRNAASPYTSRATGVSSNTLGTPCAAASIGVIAKPS